MLPGVYLNIPVFSKKTKTKNKIKYQPKQISNTENEEVVLPELGIIFLISNTNLRPLWLTQFLLLFRKKHVKNMSLWCFLNFASILLHC